MFRITNFHNLGKSLVFIIFSTFVASTTVAQNNGQNGQPFQDLQDQIDELSDRLDAIINNETIFLDVDCNAGESISAAIASVPAISPVDITISGICNEVITVTKDDVTLSGATPSDGINGSLSAIFGASRIFASDMTITANGFWGLGCFQGSALTARNIEVIGGVFAVFAFDGGQCKLSESVVRNASFGARIAKDSLGDFEGVEFSNNSTGVYAELGGDITLQSSEATFGGTIRSSVTQNNVGVRVMSGGTVDISQADVTQNFDDGVRLELGSNARISQTATVSNNGGDGVEVTGLSTAAIFGPADITNNGGWGVRCSGNTASLIFANVSGNTAGDIDANCQ